jgi:hypothetical protein
MSHTHGNHTIVCDLPTKKKCDERYSAWKAAKKLEYEHKVAEAMRVKNDLGEMAYQRFIAMEAARIAAILADREPGIMSHERAQAEILRDDR